MVFPNVPKEFVETVVGNVGVPPQLLGWNIRIKRDQSNSITCCNHLRNDASELRIAEVKCFAGEIANVVVKPVAQKCGLDKILVRLCMNAEDNRNSLHARNSNQNRAMNYMRSRLDNIALGRAYNSLLSQADARCGRILMVGMNLAPDTREWREIPRTFFDSAQHALYGSIAYEYIDDFDDFLKIDPIDPVDGAAKFASLDEQTNSFNFVANQAQFARANGVFLRELVVGPEAVWYFCSTSASR